jgi:benzodiazapine receptor
VTAARRAGLWKPILLAAIAAAFVAVLGNTVTELGPWYFGLRKPSWQPPDIAFAPVWTVIFALSAISAAIAWRDAPTKEAREWTIGLFALNGFLNVFWSLLFFRVQRPDWALMEVAFLWASVILIMLFVGRWSRLAALLLVPYLLWVSFAAVLNYEIVRLNGPFA